MRILVEQHHGIGDMVHIIPMLKNLRSTYNTSTIDLIVRTSAAEYIAKVSGLVDNIYWLPKYKLQVIVLVLKLRLHHYDIGILSVITNEKMGQIFLWLAGCKKLIFEASKQPLFPRMSIIAPRDNNMHRVERNIRLGKLAGAEDFCSRPVLDDKNKPQKHNSNRVIGFAVGTNKTRGVLAKSIPIQQQKEIISLLMKEQGVEIWLFGDSDDIDFTREIEEHKNRIYNFVGKTSIEKLMQLIQQCDIVVGGDTGTMHVADALGIATLTIFGPTAPVQFRPLGDKAMLYSLGLPCQYCYGTARIISCKDRKCLKELNVKQIVGKIVNALPKNILIK